VGAGVEVGTGMVVARLSIPGFDLHFGERTAREDTMVPVMHYHRTLYLELGNQDQDDLQGDTQTTKASSGIDM